MPPIVIDRFDGGEVDFLSARDLGANQFQQFENMSPRHITRAVKANDYGGRMTGLESSFLLPGQGFIQYRAEWDNSGTPRQVSTLYRVLARIVDSVGAWELNIHRADAKLDLGTWDTEFIDETAAKGGWERAASNRLVQGSSNVTFTASTGRISGVANLANYEVGEIIRVRNTSDNGGYFTVTAKEPAANSVDVAETLTDESNTSAYIYPLPIISMYAIKGVLRVSNGNFYDDHSSQWHGYIKRDFWGQGITYGSNGGRFAQPPMKEAHSDWKLQDQELVSPTIVAGSRNEQDTTAANEVAVHIASSHPDDWPDKADAVTWNARDRVALTFTYDFVQESELSKGANGQIGIEMGAIVSAADARGFMLEVYTGAANVSWNRRITAITLYYKFHDDPDWYEVQVFNVNKGWKESDKIFDTENTGYWIPIIAAGGGKSGTTDAGGGSGTTVNDVAHGLVVGETVYLGGTQIEPDVLITQVSAKVNDSFTIPVAAVESLGVNPANYNSLAWFGHTTSTTAVATFYVPFTGEKAFTYATNTGRAAKLKVPAIRWAAADTDGSKVLIGNVDTLDDNEQTLRERSRVFESPDGMPDTFLLTKSKDVGINLGDQIIAIKYYNGSWWVMAERNIVVLQPGNLREVARWHGRGCKWPNAFAVTPYGICMADESRITIYPSGDELTLPKRFSYKDLTFFEPAMGYDIDEDELLFIPETSGDFVTGTGIKESLAYSFITKSWGIRAFPANYQFSNIYNSGRYNHVELATELPEGIIGVFQSNHPSASNTNIGLLKTKEYHNGTPERKKNFGKGYLTYQSDNAAVLVEVYLEGNANPAKTIYLDSASSLENVLVTLNVTAKLISFVFKQATGTSGTFVIEDFIVPDSEITFLDRR